MLFFLKFEYSFAPTQLQLSFVKSSLLKLSENTLLIKCVASSEDFTFVICETMDRISPSNSSIGAPPISKSYGFHSWTMLLTILILFSALDLLFFVLLCSYIDQSILLFIEKYFYDLISFRVSCNSHPDNNPLQQ